jgi:hypothetical protein
MSDYPWLLGRLSHSGSVVFLDCPPCSNQSGRLETHEHVATPELLAGVKVLLEAKCADTITTETGRIEPNRSAYRGSYYYVTLK